MKKEPLTPGKLAEIRRQAEEAMQKRQDLQGVSTEDILSLVHELQVRQIELEMQKEELRRAQKELETSRTKYSDFYDFAPISYFTLDKNGLIIQVNLTGAKKLGMERSVLIKKPFSLFVGADCKNIFYLHLMQVFRKKTLQTTEIQCVDKKGVHFYAVLESISFQDATGAHQCRTALNDITKHVQIEKNLIASEKMYQMLVEKGNNGITIIQDNVFKFVNSMMYEITGFGKEEVIGAHFINFIAPEYREIIQERYERRLKGEILKTSYEIEILSKDGRRIPVEIFAARIEYEGRPASMVIIRDISEYKKLEELNLENECLISANKAKSEFISIISHELRTPLTSIIGYSILMKEKAHQKLSKKNEIYLDNIMKSSQHLLDLINNILVLGKIEAGKLEMRVEDIPVSEAIHEILHLFETEAELRKIIINTEIDSDLDFMQADKQKFKQILFNLISNAIKFQKNGGIITIVAKKEVDNAKFTISDNGIGIKKEDLTRIFQKFEQVDNKDSRRYEGAGLGLAITKQLIELHEGKIMVKSEYGKGTTFTFFLPLIAEKGK